MTSLHVTAERICLSKRPRARLRPTLACIALMTLAAVPLAHAEAPLPYRTAIDLGLARNYAILSKAGISSTGTTAITGNIGVSPIASTAITGFGLILDSTRTFSTSSLVTGKIFAASYASPTPARLTTAIGDVQIAYNNAAGQLNPRGIEVGGGNIGGRIFPHGLFKWSSNVAIQTDVTLRGTKDAVWIFQIAGTLNIAAGKKIILTGGALDKNIFWQVAGKTTLQTSSVMRGNILGKTAIIMRTGATLHGRALAQTAVTLDATTVTRPAF